MKCFKIILLLACVPLFMAMTSSPLDEPGSKDHPMFSRMPNYYIGEFAANFDAVTFPIGPENSETVEGNQTTIRYYIDENAEAARPSQLQIIRNYTNAAKQLGGMVVHEGECEEFHRGAVCKIVKDGSEIWLKVAPDGEGETYLLAVLEKQVMAQDVTATDMLAALNRDGRVTLYILFDTGKSDIKTESRAVIVEVTALLRNNPAIKLTVEGHTDNVGDPGANKALSESRATAVMGTLTGAGIPGERLSAAGYGQDRPIADNGTEEGRAKNRRVELVKK